MSDMIATIPEEFLKILARNGRIELIRTLRAYPDRHFTTNELARTAGVPTMTTWRAVKELRKAGLAKTRKVGNATSVHMTDDVERLKWLRLIPGTDPHLATAKAFARRLAEEKWLVECRLFGTISRGDHGPEDEVDVAVVFDEAMTTEQAVKEAIQSLSRALKEETNITIAPLPIAAKDMSKRGGLAAELRDKEVIWMR